MPQDSYIFANSRIKALETKLIKSERLYRLLDCKTLDEGVKNLYEASFGDNLTLDNVADFEKLIAAEEKKTFKVLVDVLPSREIVTAFAREYDYRNAKVLMKAKYMHREDCDKWLYDCGQIARDMLKESILSDNYTMLPLPMQKALLSCDVCMATEKNPREVDIRLDKALTLDIFDILQSCKVPEVNRYFTAQFDIKNISLVLRAKTYSIPVREVEQQLLPVEGISEALYMKAVESAQEMLPDLFLYTPYHDLVETALREGMVAFEKAADEYLLKLFEDRKGEIFTICPTLYYHAEKKIELSNVRLILIGLYNGIPQDEIRRRLREL